MTAERRLLPPATALEGNASWGRGQGQTARLPPPAKSFQWEGGGGKAPAPASPGATSRPSPAQGPISPDALQLSAWRDQAEGPTVVEQQQRQEDGHPLLLDAPVSHGELAERVREQALRTRPGPVTASATPQRGSGASPGLLH